jgi:hypothetical protein
VVRNSQSAYENGRHLSDTIAEWVKSGFVAGPFLHPPTPHFRANCLLVAVQPGKIRPILNVSQPTGGSFNDAVDEVALEKVVMTSPFLPLNSFRICIVYII